ncbi:MAG: DUF4837 family protein [Cytophagales bacterium]|nr:MAG: DUF4837 family protein [Cytophagales bacterium]
MKSSIPIILLFLIVFLSTSCDKIEEIQKTTTQSRGEIAEVVVVMAVDQWKGSLGATVKEIMTDTIPCLPQEEARFSLMHLDPTEFNNFLRHRNNVFYIITLDDDSYSGKLMRKYISKDVIEKTKTDKKVQIYAKNNEYAQGQYSLFLVGNNKSEIQQYLTNEKEQIWERFYQRERNRLVAKLYAINEQTKLNDFILSRYALKMRIPESYDVVKREENFIWLRFLSEKIDRHIWITYRDYTATEQFNPTQIQALRDSIGSQRMRADKLENSYPITETLIPICAQKISLNKRFATEYRGLWKLANGTRGGGFIAYAFVDDSAKRLYYVEAFLYAPDNEKRRFIMELEAILRTAQPVSLQIANTTKNKNQKQ